MVHSVARVGLDQVWSGPGAEEGEGRGCVGGGVWRREEGEEGGENESETSGTSWTQSPSSFLSSVSHFLPSFFPPSPTSTPICQPVGLDEGGLCVVLSDLGVGVVCDNLRDTLSLSSYGFSWVAC